MFPKIFLIVMILTFGLLGLLPIYGDDALPTDDLAPPALPGSDAVSTPAAPSSAYSTPLPSSGTQAQPSDQPPPPPAESAVAAPPSGTVPDNPPPAVPEAPSLPSPAAPAPPESSTPPPAVPSPTPEMTPTPIPAVQAPPVVQASNEAQAAPTPALTAYGQALAYFNQGKYQDSISLLLELNSGKPRNLKAFYYLGAAELKVGRRRDAAIALSVYCRYKPDSKLQNFIDHLEAGLSKDDVKWVDAQVEAYVTGVVTDLPAPVDFPQLGVSLQPEIAFINLSEFNADTQSQAFNGSVLKATDPSYQFNGTVPNAYIGVNLEPFVRMDSSLEFGIPLSYLPVGTVSDTVQSSLYGNSSLTYDLSVWMGGLDVKVLMGASPFQVFLSGGPRLASLLVNLTSTNASGSQATNFTATELGAQVQLGLDWEFAENFLLTPSIGFRWLQTSHLTGNVTLGGQSTLARLEYDSNGSMVTVVPDNGPDPAGMSPFNLDLSGPTGSLSVSALF